MYVKEENRQNSFLQNSFLNKNICMRQHNSKSISKPAYFHNASDADMKNI